MNTHGTMAIACMATVMSLCTSQTAHSQKSATCEECCRGVPQVSQFAFPSIVGTSWEVLGTDRVVHVFDVSACSTQAPGTWNPPVYEHPDWTRDKLGTVFGVTLDGAGNIYVAQTSIYNDYWSGTGLPSDYLGTVGGGVPGAILKLDSVTGAPSLFCTLPNVDPCTPGPTCAPGLGNLTYSCEHDCIYVTNFEDGRIYRVSMTGTLLEAYSFVNQAIQPPTADPADPVGLAPWGTRTWAVAVAGDRLYFSVVRADLAWFPGFPSPSPMPAPAPFNEVWSIPLAPGTGAFAGAVPTLEISVPYCGTGLWITTYSAQNIMSNPISDLAFDSDCCMYLAERTMLGLDSAAHESRLLKYCKDGAGQWQPSANTFETGNVVGPGTNAPESSAGGVGVDASGCSLVWASADYMTSVVPYYYGAIGLPTTGGVNTNGLIIDYNANLADFDKSEVGSVEVACQAATACFTISNQKILCPLPDEPGGSGSGCYTWTFNLTNNSPFSAKYVWIPLHPTPTSPITLNPNYVNLLAQDGSLLDPGETTTISVQICGGAPGDSFCIQLALEQANFMDCCFGGVDEVCLTLPECDCGQLRDQAISSVYCDDTSDPATVTFTYCFTLDNLSGESMDQVIFVPFDGEQAYFFKDFWFLPPLASGASQSMCLQVVNARPGSQFCFHVVLMHPGEDCCCEFEKCITVPDCSVTRNPCDFNGDGVVDGQDLGQLLGSWGPCQGCPWDLNGDGQVNGADLGILLGWWTT